MTAASPAEFTRGPLDDPPMSRAQIGVLAFAILLATLDGYDLLGMAFVAPVLSQAWALDRTTLGLLLSTSLVGMAVGSLAISPLADVKGRKPMVFAAILLMILGSLLSAFCVNVPQLAICRVLTGIGVGAMVPLTATIASEFASARHRAFAVALTTIGMPLGSIMGGLVASLLLARFSWQSVFLSGAVAGTLLLPIVAFILPESPAFLIARRPKDALKRVNRTLARLDRTGLSELPRSASAPRASYRSLFSPGMVGMTLGFSTITVLVSTTAYYLINWLPQLITEAGYPPSVGSLASATSSIVGLVAGIAFGALANRLGPARLASGAMMGFGLAIATFGFVPPVLVLLVLSAAACGFFLSGCTGIFYATVAASFPPLSRVSGLGFAMGTGRIVSIAGPALAGWLFARGLGRAEVSLVFAVGPILAGFLLIAISRRRNEVIGVPSAAPTEGNG